MGIYLVSIWLLVGGSTLMLQRRLRATSSQTVAWNNAPVLLLVVGAVAGALIVFTPDPWASAFVWTTLCLVNLALALSGWHMRMLAVIGTLVTAAGITLVAIHAWSSLPVMAAAGVLSLGAALIGSSATQRAPRTILER